MTKFVTFWSLEEPTVEEDIVGVARYLAEDGKNILVLETSVNGGSWLRQKLGMGYGKPDSKSLKDFMTFYKGVMSSKLQENKSFDQHFKTLSKGDFQLLKVQNRLSYLYMP